MSMLNQNVIIENETAAGVPIFKGTRVVVKTFFDCLEDSSLAESLEGFPAVSRQQAVAVIKGAAAKFLPEIAV